MPSLRFSTEGLPARQRFEACRARVAGWKELRPGPGVSAPDDFRLTTAAWRLGPLALCWTDAGDATANIRRAAHIRRDMLDHWAVSVVRRGTLRGECGGETFRSEPGVPLVSGLHRPQICERGAAEWVTLFVPRDAAPELAATLDTGPPVRPLEGGLGALLAAHLVALPAALDRLPPADAPRTAEATLALLRAAVAGAARAEGGGGGDGVPARAELEETLRARLLALVRREIGSVRLDPGRLARLAGMSRTRLYEVFEPEGGVARAIQRERLRAVRRALADPAEARPIAALAEAMGFADPSVFSRAFRREFGLTAGEFRERARMGLGLEGEWTAAAAAGPADLLRGLRP